MNRSVVCLLLVLAAAGCTRGSGGSPTCGLAMLAGPALITSQLTNARAVLTDPPRGIPDSLPAMVILQRNDRRSEEHTSELQSRLHLVCRLLLEKKKTTKKLQPI